MLNEARREALCEDQCAGLRIGRVGLRCGGAGRLPRQDQRHQDDRRRAGGAELREGHIANEAARNKRQSENDKKEVLQQVDNLEIESTNVKHMSLKEATNGAWKKIPDSDKANACFLSSVRLPPQGLCQITYQGNLDRWSYNASDIAGAGFVCTATCVWVKVHRKEQAADTPAKE